MLSKYIKTIQLFTELPTPSKNAYNGNCSMGIEPYKRVRPCSAERAGISCINCSLNRKVKLKLIGE